MAQSDSVIYIINYQCPIGAQPGVPCWDSCCPGALTMSGPQGRLATFASVEAAQHALELSYVRARTLKFLGWPFEEEFFNPGLRDRFRILPLEGA